MALVGSLEPFSLDSDNWRAYAERVEQYFVANEINTEEKMRGVFLTVIGSETYNLLRSLLAPTKPAEKSFKDLVEILRAHLNPKPIVIAERFKFYSRVQLPGEAINTYIAELRKMTEYCEFGGFLNDALRDKFVCGLNNTSIRKRLLTEKNLTLDNAINMATSIVASITESELMKSSDNIHSITKSYTRRCFRCSGEDHLADSCRFKQYICRK